MMKVSKKAENKKDKVKKKGVIHKAKPKKEKVLVVAQEIKYARLLSSNEKKTRDKVLKALKKWLTNCFEKNYEFKEEDFTRVWKGLFYAVWMSDKPLIQEQLCEDIAGILDLFPPEQLDHALLMTKAGLKMLATEWYGIDQHRMDKFLMLVRRYLRGSLRCLKRCEWSLKSCQKYANMLSGSDGILAVQTPHYARNASSMLIHYTDCFLEELSKVSSGVLPDVSMTALLRPFVLQTARGSAPALCGASRRLLTALLRCSELGLQYGDRTRAWKQMGCPEGGPEALEPASDDDDVDDDEPQMNGHTSDDEQNDDGSPLDPRAGRVDVVLSPLPVPADLVAGLLREVRGVRGAASCQAQTRLNICIQRFESLSRGVYPLRAVPPPPSPCPGGRGAPRRSAMELHALEQQLKLDADELKLRGLSRKHRKRLLKKSRSGLSIVEDVEKINTTETSKSGEWIVESTEPKESDKENQHKTKKNKQNDKKRLNTEQQHEVRNKKIKLDKNTDNTVKKLSKKDKNKLKVKKTPVAEQEPKKDVIKKDTVKTESKGKDAKVGKLQKQENKLSNKVTKPKNDKSSKSKETVNKIKQLVDKTNDNQECAEKLRNNAEKVMKTNINDKSKKLAEKVNTKEKAYKVDKKKKFLEKPTFLVNKVKKFQKQLPNKEKTDTKKTMFDTPKRVKFVLKNNSMQKPVDYYKSVKQSPNIPFDSSKQPTKTNLKPSTPSPINPFFKKKLRMKN